MSDRGDEADPIATPYREPWSRRGVSLERQDVLSFLIVVVSLIAVDMLTPLGWIN